MNIHILSTHSVFSMGGPFIYGHFAATYIHNTGMILQLEDNHCPAPVLRWRNSTLDCRLHTKPIWLATGASHMHHSTLQTRLVHCTALSRDHGGVSGQFMDLNKLSLRRAVNMYTHNTAPTFTAVPAKALGDVCSFDSFFLGGLQFEEKPLELIRDVLGCIL